MFYSTSLTNSVKLLFISSIWIKILKTAKLFSRIYFAKLTSLTKLFKLSTIKSKKCSWLFIKKIKKKRKKWRKASNSFPCWLLHLKFLTIQTFWAIFTKKHAIYSKRVWSFLRKSLNISGQEKCWTAFWRNWKNRKGNKI